MLKLQLTLYRVFLYPRLFTPLSKRVSPLIASARLCNFYQDNKISPDLDRKVQLIGFYLNATNNVSI